MTLVVEDGTGKADAEAFCDFAYATAYHTAMGNTGFPTDQTQGEAALRRGALYMARFRQRWAGTRNSTTQALDWPRQMVAMRDSPLATQYYLPNNAVPVDIKKANAEYALRAAAADLDPDQTRGILSESVGPISTTYDPASPQQPRYPLVEALLDPYFSGGGGNSIRLLRG